MAAQFDPYHKWLGIPPEEQPPNHYRLLGIQIFESDEAVIESAAERQMVYLHHVHTGPHLSDAQRLLNEVAAAKLCLLDRKQKVNYDAQLRLQHTRTSQLFAFLRSRKPSVRKTFGWKLLTPVLIVLAAIVMVVFLSHHYQPDQVEVVNEVIDSETLPSEEQESVTVVQEDESNNQVVDVEIDKGEQGNPEQVRQEMTTKNDESVLKNKPVELKTSQAVSNTDEDQPNASNATVDFSREQAIAKIQELGGNVTANPADQNQLQHLRMQKITQREISLAFLSALPELRTVDFNKTPLSDDQLAHFSKLQNLEVVNLSGTGITDAGIEHLAGLKHLQELELYRTQVTDAGLVPLAKMTSLRILDLAETGVTGRGLAHIKQLSQIERLFLDGTQLTDEGMPNLKSMDKMKRLYLGRTQITDVGVKHIAGMRQLERLYLEDTSVSDSSLPILKKLAKLQRLNIKNTKISEIGVIQLQRALKQCQISHSTTAVQPGISPASNDESKIAWMVIFRSADPLIWNTSTDEGPERYAVPVDHAPKDTRWIRIRNMSNNEAVYLQVRSADLGKNFRAGRFQWCGELEVENRQANGKPQNNATLGIANLDWPQKYTPGAKAGVYVGRSTVDRKGASGYRGWGFGKYSHVYSPQCWSWKGEEIANNTVFEIAVSSELEEGVDRSSVLSWRWKP